MGENKKLTNLWKMLYIAMNDIKAYMDTIYKENSGEITKNDFDKVENYIHRVINTILKYFNEKEENQLIKKN